MNARSAVQSILELIYEFNYLRALPLADEFTRERIIYLMMKGD